MQIEHISRSYRRQIRNRKNVCVRFGGQQDASTSKVSFGQPAQMCHNNPPTSRWVNPSQFYKSQRCPEKSTQGQQAKSQRSSKTVNPLTSIFVPNSTAFKNRTFHQFSAWLDQALTKVNAGQTFCETLAAENPYGLSSSSFPRLAEIRPPGSSYSLRWERKMWVECNEILSNFSCIYIHQWGCVTHLFGMWAYMTKLTDLAHIIY